jgi:hypothetical protein
VVNEVDRHLFTIESLKKADESRLRGFVGVRHPKKRVVRDSRESIKHLLYVWWLFVVDAMRKVRQLYSRNSRNKKIRISDGVIPCLSGMRFAI